MFSSVLEYLFPVLSKGGVRSCAHSLSKQRSIRCARDWRGRGGGGFRWAGGRQGVCKGSGWGGRSTPQQVLGEADSEEGQVGLEEGLEGQAKTY